MTIEELRQQLIRHEGLRLKPYKCSANKLTIGVGRNIEERGISQGEAYYMLDNDIVICIAELEANYPELMQNLSENRKGVLVNMCFNLGISRLRGFKNMFKALEKGDFMEAANQMLDSRWSKQVGERSYELADIMRTDQY